MAKANVLDEFMAKRESASYDATKIDPATVAALNAADDRTLEVDKALSRLLKPPTKRQAEKMERRARQAPSPSRW